MAGPTLYAFLLRDGHAFQFMATGGEGEPGFEERLAAFKSLISRFEYRPLFSVPTRPGLCVPYGFFADDGNGHFRGAVSFRYSDAPGVIYTLTTAVEGERNFDANTPLIEATARSTVAGLMGSGWGRPLKAWGPKPVNIGARKGLMGGISVAATPAASVPASDPYDGGGTIPARALGYSFYAGTDGFAHSHVLPHIALDMRSFDREIAPELTQDPPPLELSLPRYETTLHSLRTRKAQDAGIAASRAASATSGVSKAP